MPDYTLPLNLNDPQNAIDRELAHIRAHCTNEGLTMSNPVLLTGPLRLRVTVSGALSQSLRDHFVLTLL